LIIAQLLSTPKIYHSRRYSRAKIKNFKIFFTAHTPASYGSNHPADTPLFRTKRASSSNYGGQVFRTKASSKGQLDATNAAKKTMLQLLLFPADGRCAALRQKPPCRRV
jgi:hypothetical protein